MPSKLLLPFNLEVLLLSSPLLGIFIIIEVDVEEFFVVNSLVVAERFELELKSHKVTRREHARQVVIQDVD